MTERKPTGLSFESWVDKQIREATERGEFDDLPGAGKPLKDLDKPYDEVWVLRQLEREGASTEDLLPASLKLRKEIERLAETVRPLPSEQAVRDAVEDLNARVLAWLRAPSGPLVQVRPVKVDDVVRQWRADRETALRPRTEATAHPATASEPASRPGRWWHRFARGTRGSD